ncbi:hypothetical protein ES704_02039 [subsurface metagenome]|jgi:hypothetical protein
MADEDKAKWLSPYDFKRLLEAALGWIVSLWKAKAPEQIYSADIRTADTFYSTMVDWTEGKRFVIKVESSLDQAVIIQAIGNITNTTVRAININGPLACTIDGNISIGFAWDDWHPYIGIEITTAIAPTAGTLTIWAVVQE